MAAALRLYLLGEFRLERSGEALRLPTTKTKALLAYLALNPHKHPREKLATLFWGDSIDTAARKSLRVAFQHLYQAIGKDAFDGDYDAVQLDPGAGLWVDALAFSENAAHVKQNDGAATHQELAAVLGEYRGELLEGFYEDWVTAAREEFKAQYIALALKLVERYRAASEYARAAETARKILATDRAQEHAHQHLIFLYAAQGDRTAALAQFEACKRALDEELGVAPVAETIALAEKIKLQKMGGTAAATQLTNLAKPMTSFVGREQELKELETMLTTDNGRAALVTCSGTGGSGKTRLAYQVGRALVNEFPDGVWCVELAPLSDAALVPFQVAKALGVREQTNTPLRDTLADFLRTRSLLLILDNCEHLIDASAEIAEFLQRHAPQLVILATSREALNIPGEQNFPVAPLSIPKRTVGSQADLALEFSAVQLFAERARLAVPHFRLDEENAPHIIRICQRLDGIPLALELAAVRVKYMPVQEIAARLDDRFSLLTDGSRIVLPRQQTLRALIDWSFDLLNPTERVLFQRLAVFAGNWTLDEAKEICADAALAPERIGGGLLQLASKSLLQVDTTRDATEYFLLESFREYAREKLDAAGEAYAVRSRHLDYFLALAEQAETHVWDEARDGWMARLDDAQDNLRAAFDFAIASGDSDHALRLAGTLADYWRLRSRIREGTESLQRALETARADSSPQYVAKAFSGAGTMAWLRGDLKEAEQLHTHALERFRAAGDVSGAGYALRNLGGTLIGSDDLISAHRVLLEALEIGRAIQDENLIQSAYLNLGALSDRFGDHSSSENYHTQALVIARGRQNLPMVVTLLCNLACLARVRQDYVRAHALFAESDWLGERIGYTSILNHNFIEKGKLFAAEALLPQAIQNYREGLKRGQASGEQANLMQGLGGMGAVRHAQGKLQEGVRLFAFAEALGERTGLSWQRDERIEYTERKTALREALGAASFDAAWQTGQALTLDQAVRLALEG